MGEVVEDSEEEEGRHANTEQQPLLFLKGDDEIEKGKGNEVEVVVFSVREQFR